MWGSWSAGGAGPEGQERLRLVRGGVSRVGSVRATIVSTFHIGRVEGRWIGVQLRVRIGGMAHGRHRRLVRGRVLGVVPPTKSCGSRLGAVFLPPSRGWPQGPSGQGIGAVGHGGGVFSGLV